MDLQDPRRSSRPERAREMGAAGRDKVLVRHTWPRVLEQFQLVLRLAAMATSDGSVSAADIQPLTGRFTGAE